MLYYSTWWAKEVSVENSIYIKLNENFIVFQSRDLGHPWMYCEDLRKASRRGKYIEETRTAKIGGVMDQMILIKIITVLK